MKKITSTILFDSPSRTGIDKLMDGEQFAVMISDKINFYKIKHLDMLESNTTIQTAIDNGWVVEVRAGDIEPILKIYSSGIPFKQNELFADDTKSKFYVALTDFTATGNLEQDKDNGYIKDIGNVAYKQIETTVNANDVLIIPYQNQNTIFNRHAFVLKQQNAESNVSVIFTDFNETETKWDYDENWMVQDGQMHLKLNRYYEATQSTTDDGTIIFERTISTSDYQDIKSIGAIAY